MKNGFYKELGHWYPEYPDLGATVAKFRGKANRVGSISEMLASDRRAYADAIEKSIRTKQRAALVRPTPSPSAGWYQPPSIARLLHYAKPIKMQGDPDWDPCNCGIHAKCYCDHWGAREQAVYAHAMEEKRSGPR